jgi:hypothetical protein
MLLVLVMALKLKIVLECPKQSLKATLPLLMGRNLLGLTPLVAPLLIRMAPNQDQIPLPQQPTLPNRNSLLLYCRGVNGSNPTLPADGSTTPSNSTNAPAGIVDQKQSDDADEASAANDVKLRNSISYLINYLIIYLKTIKHFH